jgi:hypothetical protein
MAENLRPPLQPGTLRPPRAADRLRPDRPHDGPPHLDAHLVLRRGHPDRS